MLGGLGAGLPGGPPPAVPEHLAADRCSTTPASCSSAGAMICAVGVLDDLIELDALTKLGGQILAAGFMVLNDVQLYSLKLPGVGQFVLDPTPGRAADHPAGGRHDQRGQLRRRPRRPGRRRGADRRGRVLRCSPTSSPTPTARPWRSRRRCCAPRWVAPAPASCRTTSSRPASSWATRARCCSAWCSSGSALTLTGQFASRSRCERRRRQPRLRS